jgi:hypothetical protein
MRNPFLTLAMAVALALAPTRLPAQAAPGPLIPYQGHLVQDGQPANGPHTFSFVILDSTGKTIYSSGTLTVVVTGGIYSVILGDTSVTGMNALPAGLGAQSGLQLQVSIDGTLMSPTDTLVPILQAQYVTGPFLGDVTGTQGATVISSIQGLPLTLTGATTGNVLTFNGTSWVPAAGTPGPAGAQGPAGATGATGAAGLPGTPGPVSATVLINATVATTSLSYNPSMTTLGFSVAASSNSPQTMSGNNTFTPPANGTYQISLTVAATGNFGTPGAQLIAGMTTLTGADIPNILGPAVQFTPFLNTLGYNTLTASLNWTGYLTTAQTVTFNALLDGSSNLNVVPSTSTLTIIQY